jgi:hypothetical protein
MATAAYPAAISRNERFIVAVSAFGLALLYFLFRSRNHPIDAVLYALAADVKDAYPFFHWHHLLYTPATWLFLKAARWAGYGGGVFAPIAAVSAASAAGAAVFLYFTIRRLGGTVASASIATAFLSFSSAWWYFAGEVEVLAVISLFITGALYILAGRDAGWRSALGLACWLGVGTLFHQAISLFVPVAAIVLAWDKRGRRARLLTFGCAYGILALVPYVLIPRFYYGVRGWSEWVGWVTYYLSWGDWGYFTRERIARGVVTTLGAVVAGPDPFDVGTVLSGRQVLAEYLPAVLVLGGALATIGAGVESLWRTRRRWLVAAAVWFVFYFSFFTWWEPENAEWAIATTIPVWLLFGLSVVKRRAFYAAAVCVLTCVAGLNGTRLIYPASMRGRNEAEVAARAIVSQTAPGDAVLISHLDVYAWTDLLGRHTRKLYTPFVKANAAGAGEFAAAEANGFDGYAAEGGRIYFTDYEWDEKSPADAEAMAKMKIALFKMMRNGAPAAGIKFPQGPRVLYRFEGSGDDLRDVAVYEAEGDNTPARYALLATTGASAEFAVDIPKRDKYVLCVQARGQYAAGEWPVMEVLVDGMPLGETPVDGPYWGFYEAGLTLGAGTHNIKTTFRNDYYDASTDSGRDLLVNRLIVYRRALSEPEKADPPE